MAGAGSVTQVPRQLSCRHSCVKSAHRVCRVQQCLDLQAQRSWSWAGHQLVLPIAFQIQGRHQSSLGMLIDIYF